MTALLEEAPVRELTLRDRCDRCAAAAQQIFSKGNSVLLFCNHHGNKYAMDLFAGGWEVTKSEGVLCGCTMCLPFTDDQPAPETEHPSKGGFAPA